MIRAHALSLVLLLAGTAAPAQTVASAERAASSAAQPAMVKVAVLDLAVVDNTFNGDSKKLAAWFREQRIDPTDLLRDKIARTETYAALEDPPLVVSIGRLRIEDALRTAGAEPVTCATACAVRVGKAVGADRVVTGEVTKLSNLIWFVTGRAVDVRAGKVVRQDELEVKGVIQDMMPKVMASLSRRLVTPR
jgi:hypothetical protein